MAETPFPFEGKLVPATAGNKIADSGDINETDDKFFVSQAEKDQINAGGSILISSESGTLAYKASRVNFSYAGILPISGSEYTVSPTLRVRNNNTSVRDGVAFINFPADGLLEAVAGSPDDWVDIRFTGTQGVVIAEDNTDTGVTAARINFPDAVLSTRGAGEYDIQTGLSVLDDNTTLNNINTLTFPGDYLDVAPNPVDIQSADIKFEGSKYRGFTDTQIIFEQQEPNLRFAQFDFNLSVSSVNEEVEVEWAGFKVDDAVNPAFEGIKNLSFVEADFAITDLPVSDTAEIKWAGMGVADGINPPNPTTKNINFDGEDFAIDIENVVNTSVKLNQPEQLLAYVREPMIVNITPGNEFYSFYNEEVINKGDLLESDNTTVTLKPNRQYFISWVSSNSNQGVVVNGGGASILNFKVVNKDDKSVVTDIKDNPIEQTDVFVLNGEQFNQILISAFVDGGANGKEIQFEISSPQGLNFSLDSRTTGPSGICIQEVRPNVEPSEALLTYSQDTRNTFTFNFFDFSEPLLDLAALYALSDTAVDPYTFGPDIAEVRNQGYVLYSGEESITFSYQVTPDKAFRFQNIIAGDPSLPYVGQVLSNEVTELIKGDLLNVNWTVEIASPSQLGCTCQLVRWTGTPDDFVFNAPKIITGVVNNNGIWEYQTAANWELGGSDLITGPGRQSSTLSEFAPADTNNLACLILPTIDPLSGNYTPFDYLVLDFKLFSTNTPYGYLYKQSLYADVGKSYLRVKQDTQKTIPSNRTTIRPDDVVQKKFMDYRISDGVITLYGEAAFLVQLDFNVQTTNANTTFNVWIEKFNGTDYDPYPDSGMSRSYSAAGTYRESHTYIIVTDQSQTFISCVMNTSDISGCTLEGIQFNADGENLTAPSHSITVTKQ